MSLEFSTLLVGLLAMVLTGYELARTFLTGATYNVMRRGVQPRVARATDPGLFWFAVAVEAGLFLLGAYLVATSGIGSAFIASLR